MLRQTANPERYKGDPNHPAALKEVYSKLQAFHPDRIAVLVEACQTLLDNVVRWVGGPQGQQNMSRWSGVCVCGGGGGGGVRVSHCSFGAFVCFGLGRSKVCLNAF